MAKSSYKKDDKKIPLETPAPFTGGQGDVESGGAIDVAK